MSKVSNDRKNKNSYEYKLLLLLKYCKLSSCILYNRKQQTHEDIIVRELNK